MSLRKWDVVRFKKSVETINTVLTEGVVGMVYLVGEDLVHVVVTDQEWALLPRSTAEGTLSYVYHVQTDESPDTYWANNAGRWQ